MAFAILPRSMHSSCVSGDSPELCAQRADGALDPSPGAFGGDEAGVVQGVGEGRKPWVKRWQNMAGFFGMGQSLGSFEKLWIEWENPVDFWGNMAG